MKETNEQSRKASGKLTVIISILLFALICASAFIYFVLRGPAVKEVIISDDSLNLTVGDSFPLTYMVLPENAKNRAVEWTSSNPEAASVSDSGVVTAVGVGSTVITVVSESGKLDECLINVEPAKPSAFDFMKSLCISEGEKNGSTYSYPVSSYTASSGHVITIGVIYSRASDTLNLMNVSEYANQYCYIAVPHDLSGDYDGYLEWTYSARTIHAYYSIDAASLTETTSLHCYSCDGKSWDFENSDGIFRATVTATLSVISRDLLVPNDYELRDLGFSMYS